MAMSTLTVLPIFILFIMFQRLLIEGIATTRHETLNLSRKCMT